MIPSVSIRQAFCDPQLLGGVLAGSSWQAWRVLLTAAMGERLNDDERATFTKLTGREREPGERVEEMEVVAGRRAGKTRAMATLACYIAGLCRHDLVRGERGVLLCIAPDQKQAGITLDYCTAAFEDSPILRQLIANRTADTLELTNGISIEVRAASFRRLRGPTYIAVLADEAAFWMSDESANPDVEILGAVRPGLATTAGPLVIVSSPYARKGVLWETYRRHYGRQGDELVLVAQGASRDLNPSLPESVVSRALERDRAAASAEYLAQFRTDIEGFVAFETVQACVGDHVEMAPLEAHTYFGFVDPSGGSSDSFTMAISHRDGERAGVIVIDAIRETRPPFSPAAVVDELAALLKSYRIGRVVGDRYGGEFPRELFRKHGITYTCCGKSKSDLFRDMLPLLNSGGIVLPRSDRLVNQIVSLERRTTRAGRDSIDHAPNAHDDLANCVAGVADLLAHREDLNQIDLGEPQQVDRGPSGAGAMWGAAGGCSPDWQDTPWLW
jgi:hypothetical protein